MSFVKLLLSFFKVGLIGFGGGSALIPVIRNELVETRRAMSEEEYLRHTVVANITPGALPVKLGATCGFSLGRVAGALAGAWAVALPGVLGTVLIIALFSLLGQEAIDYLNYASLGITVFIVYLLTHYIIKTVRAGTLKVNAVLCAIAFLITGGKEAREVLHLLFHIPGEVLGIPLLDISMINVMILSFYLIIYHQLAAGRSLLPGAVLGGVYALCCGKLLGSWAYAGTARLVMVAAFVASLLLLRRGREKTGGETASLKFQRPIMISILIFLAVPVALCAGALALGLLSSAGDSLVFLANVLVSTVTSFGGGEAYIAIADSIFVQAGYLPADLFYGQVVPVANALPGPILIKVAAAIGFVYGQSAGSFVGGVALSVISAALSIGACCAVAMVVLNFYDALKDSTFIRSLKRYILPVICGTLISTSLAMLCESMKITTGYGLGAAPTFGIMVACVALTAGLKRKLRIHDLLMLAIAIVISLGLMLLLR